MKARRMLFLILGIVALLALSVAPARRLQAQGTGPAPQVTSDVTTDATGDPEPQATTAAPPEQTAGEAETKDQTPSPEPPVTNRATPYLVNGALVVLALLTVAFTVSFFREISRDRPAGIGIETSWGGFGGGLGGWKISPSLVYLLASLVFGSLLCMAVVGLMGKDRQEESASTKKTEASASGEKAEDGK